MNKHVGKLTLNYVSITDSGETEMSVDLLELYPEELDDDALDTLFAHLRVFLDRIEIEMERRDESGKEAWRKLQQSQMPRIQKHVCRKSARANTEQI